MTLFSRTTRWSSLAFVSVLFTAAGCPGSLEDRAAFEQFPDCPGNLDVEQIFAAKCGSSICHGGQSGEPQGGLDLTSPELAARLVGAHSSQCSGWLRVDPSNPDRSFLLAKVTSPPAGCGDRMPLVGALTEDEILCIRAFVHQLAAEPVPDAGAQDAGAQDAGAQDASTDASSDAAASTDAGNSDADVDGGP